MKRILIVASLTALLSACGSGSPESILEHVYRAVDDGNIKVVTDSIIRPEGGATRDLIDISVRKHINEFAAHKGLKSMKFVCNTKGDLANCQDDFLFNDGSEKHDTDQVEKTSGGWKIAPN